MTVSYDLPYRRTTVMDTDLISDCARAVPTLFVSDVDPALREPNRTALATPRDTPAVSGIGSVVFAFERDSCRPSTTSHRRPVRYTHAYHEFGATAPTPIGRAGETRSEFCMVEHA